MKKIIESELLSTVILLVAGLGIVALCIYGFSCMEARTYNRLTGSDVSGFDAVWVELRVVEPLGVEQTSVTTAYGFDSADWETVQAWYSEPEPMAAKDLTNAVYDESGFKLPTPIGDAVVWFSNSVARDSFKARMAADPSQYRLFDLPSWAEVVEMRKTEGE